MFRGNSFFHPWIAFFEKKTKKFKGNSLIYCSAAKRSSFIANLLILDFWLSEFYIFDAISSSVKFVLAWKKVSVGKRLQCLSLLPLNSPNLTLKRSKFHPSIPPSLMVIACLYHFYDLLNLIKNRKQTETTISRQFLGEIRNSRENKLQFPLI